MRSKGGGKEEEMAGALSVGEARQEMIVELLCPWEEMVSYHQCRSNSTAERYAPLVKFANCLAVLGHFGECPPEDVDSKRVKKIAKEIQIWHPLQCEYGRAMHHQQQRNHLHYLYRFLSSVNDSGPHAILLFAFLT